VDGSAPRRRAALLLLDDGAGAGADPTLLTTRAERDGDEWVINGHKWFSSNASISDFLIVMCLTNPDVEAYRRYSMIIVPTRTPGVNILRGRPDHG
jgi:acyl-CoA dehydrogenase